MRRGIAVAEPESLNEIRERVTRPIRTKTHFNDLVKTVKRFTFLARTRARFRVAINNILKVAPVRGASRIPKPRDRPRIIHGYAGPSREITTHCGRVEQVPKRGEESRSVQLLDTVVLWTRRLRS